MRLVTIRSVVAAIRAVPTALRLTDEEARLRTRARRIELDPRRDEEAAEWFGRADRARDDRLALLRRCGLL